MLGIQHSASPPWFMCFLENNTSYNSLAALFAAVNQMIYTAEIVRLTAFGAPVPVLEQNVAMGPYLNHAPLDPRDLPEVLLARGLSICVSSRP
eukprot:SAG11_NODE_3216_length_2604_cov_3.862275_3_plen_93_part_00